MKLASSLDRYKHALATSAGVDPLPNGTVATNPALFSSVSGFPRNSDDLGKFGHVLLAHERHPLSAYLGSYAKHLQSSVAPKYRRYRVEPDLLGPILDSHRLGRIDDSRLGRIVPRKSRPRSYARRRSHIHKRTRPSTLQEVRKQNIGGQVDGLDVQVETQVKVLVGHLLGGLVRIGAARVVDNDVQPAKLVGRQLQEGFPVLSFGDIALLEEGGIPELLGDGLACVGGEVGNDHFGALCDEFGGDAAAEA